VYLLGVIKYLSVNKIIFWMSTIIVSFTFNNGYTQELNKTAIINADFPGYTVTRTKAPIIIDGKIDEEDWKLADEVELVDNLKDGKPRLKTTIRFLWDNEYLYAAFYCEDPDAWTIYTKEDEPVWYAESVELLIDPDGNGFNYYALEIAPNNVKFDAYSLAHHDGKRQYLVDWDFLGLKSAIYCKGDSFEKGTKDEYWTAEIALWFPDFWDVSNIPPEDGDMWRLNAYRQERERLKVDREEHPEAMFVAFSPTESHFHVPSKFGKIIFKK
jgi:hypothetical protein